MRQILFEEFDALHKVESVTSSPKQTPLRSAASNTLFLARSMCLHTHKKASRGGRAARGAECNLLLRGGLHRRVLGQVLLGKS